MGGKWVEQGSDCYTYGMRKWNSGWLQLMAQIKLEIRIPNLKSDPITPAEQYDGFIPCGVLDVAILALSKC